jgi:transcriptional regulator of NAD metabolism
MEARERRSAILQLLRNRTAPMTGGELAARMGVSRQVIVQDIALLRTGGNSIFATPEGYVLPAATPKAAARRVIAARHVTNEGMRDELETIVDLGGTMVDVSIEHAVYGEITAPLMLRTRMGVDVFMAHFEQGDTAPISLLTGGVHLHTVEAPSENVMEEIVSALRRKGYLLE